MNPAEPVPIWKSTTLRPFIEKFLKLFPLCPLLYRGGVRSGEV